MTYTTEITLWCDDCAEWDQVSACGGVRAARKRLKREKGWSNSRGNDYCPACTKKRKEVLDERDEEG